MVIRFSSFFEDKIRRLRSSFTSSFRLASEKTTNCHLENFSPVSQIIVLKVIRSHKIKSCSLDPLPVSVFSRCKDCLLPTITDIINDSLKAGVFPALIVPTLKKSSLDPENLKNYRPISNLSFISKVIERVICTQLMTYLASNSLLASRQFAYRENHSVEKALLRVQMTYCYHWTLETKRFLSFST